MKHNYYYSDPFVLAYDSGEKETYTKDEVAALVAETESKVKETFSKSELALKEEIAALQSKASLTDKERKDLNDRVEQLSSQQKSVAQQAQIEREKLLAKFEKEKQELTQGVELWRNKFTTQLVEGSLLSAAAKHKAYNPEQIVRLFGSQTQLIEELDATGQKTGNLKPVVKISVKDSKGVTQNLELDPDAALKAISEQEDYANLFSDPSKGGRGGSNGGAAPDMSAILADPKAFREARKQGKI